MPKPVNLGFDQAAAVGDSAFTALAAVRDQGKVQPGHRVLINGASGGVGTCAVQLAKSLGARVTAVCGSSTVELSGRSAPTRSSTTPPMTSSKPVSDTR